MKSQIIAALAALVFAMPAAAEDKPSPGPAPLRLELVAAKPGKLRAVLHNTGKTAQEYLVDYDCCSPSQPVVLTLTNAAGAVEVPFDVCLRVSCKAVGLPVSRDKFERLGAGKKRTVVPALVDFQEATGAYRVVWGTNIFSLNPGVYQASAVWVSQHRDVSTPKGIETLDNVWLGRLEAGPVKFTLPPQAEED